MVIFDLVTLTLKFDLLLKNINLGHNFLTRRDRAFILHMCIPCDDPFMCTIIFDLVTLTLKFCIFLKNFNLGHNFLTRRNRDSYCTYVFLVTRPFTWYRNFLPCYLDLEVWPTFENFNSGFYLHYILVMVAAREASLSSDNSYLQLKYDVISQINHSFAEFPFFVMPLIYDYELLSTESPFTVIFLGLMEVSLLKRTVNFASCDLCMMQYSLRF